MRRFGLITGQARRPDSITDYLAILRSRWGVLVAVPLLAMIAAGLIGLTTTPRYSATAVIYFAPPPAEAPNGLLPNLHYAQDIVGSHALVATESRILAPVITRLGLATTPEDLAHDVSASARTDTLIVEVEARALTGRGAAALADAVAREISQSVAALNPRVTGNYSPLRVYSVAAAEVPLQPSIPRTGLNLMVALVLGTLGGMILCIAIEHFAPRVRSPRDLQRAVSVPVMGRLPRQVTARTGRLGRQRRPFGDRATDRTTGPAAAQAMSDVYSGLRVIFQDNDFQVIAFVSGSSQVSRRVATEVADLLVRDGVRSILVDADIPVRRLTDEVTGDIAGLSDVIAGTVDWRQVVVPGSTAVRADRLPAGCSSADPAELLDRLTVDRLLPELRAAYAMVVLNLASMTRTADWLALTEAVDGMFLVADHPEPSYSELMDTLVTLHRRPAPLAGVLLNG
ncbi:MAG: Wzz/FepE/Etk N-terminal domain-containing protein [Kineosporiaceae bacterium]